MSFAKTLKALADPVRRDILALLKKVLSLQGKLLIIFT